MALSEGEKKNPTGTAPGMLTPFAIFCSGRGGKVIFSRDVLNGPEEPFLTPGKLMTDLQHKFTI